MRRRRETEPKKLISFIKELRTLLPEQKAKLEPGKIAGVILGKPSLSSSMAAVAR